MQPDSPHSGAQVLCIVMRRGAFPEGRAVCSRLATGPIRNLAGGAALRRGWAFCFPRQCVERNG